MDESTEKTGSAAPNKTTTMLLAVIAVLLVAVAVILFVNQSGSNNPGTPATTDTGGATGGMPSGMGGSTAEVPFDPATATKVEAGKGPEDHVKAYFDAVVAGDYTTAFAMLPTSKQAEYGTEQAFSDQLKSYGIESYTIDDVAETDTESQVTASASMAGGAFQYLWTFVKEGDSWLVKSRTLPGMGN
jgi:hypothetical protein